MVDILLIVVQDPIAATTFHGCHGYGGNDNECLLKELFVSGTRSTISGTTTCLQLVPLPLIQDFSGFHTGFGILQNFPKVPEETIKTAQNDQTG